jgi:hypothetical protein
MIILNNALMLVLLRCYLKLMVETAYAHMTALKSKVVLILIPYLAPTPEIQFSFKALACP